MQIYIYIYIKEKKEDGNDKGWREKLNKYEKYIPISSASWSPPFSSSESEILLFMMGSSSKSSRTYSDPLEDKYASDPHVVKLGMEEGVTTKKEPSFTA